MANDWKATLERDPEYHWWTGWVKVPTLASIRIEDEEEENPEEGDAEASAEADEEADAELAEAEGVLDDMMKAFTDPTALMDLMQKLNPAADPDALVPGGGGRTLRDLVNDSAEEARRVEAGEFDDEFDADNARLDALEAAEREHRAIGELEVILDVEEDDDAGDEGATREPTPAQLAAVDHLRANEARLSRAILAAVAEHYARVRDDYADLFEMIATPEEAERNLPATMSADDAARHVTFHVVNVERRERDGLAYVRLGGACTWDEEHGIAVTLHGDRVVGVGLDGETLEDDAG